MIRAARIVRRDSQNHWPPCRETGRTRCSSNRQSPNGLTRSIALMRAGGVIERDAKIDHVALRGEGHAAEHQVEFFAAGADGDLDFFRESAGPRDHGDVFSLLRALEGNSIVRPAHLVRADLLPPRRIAWVAGIDAVSDMVLPIDMVDFQGRRRRRPRGLGHPAQHFGYGGVERRCSDRSASMRRRPSPSLAEATKSALRPVGGARSARSAATRRDRRRCPT